MSGPSTNWKGLDTILSEVGNHNPGARLEHTLTIGEDEREEWRGEPEKKILLVERWLQIVKGDIRNAPTNMARQIIVGPFYSWDYDEFGRVIISAEHQGRPVPMFVEVWAGEPG